MPWSLFSLSFLLLVSLSAHAAAPDRLTRFGLRNDDFTRKGFQGETYPVGAADAPKVFSAGDQLLAIQSPACASLLPAIGSCLNYLEVDAFIALDDELSLREVRDFSALHPWKRNPRYRDRVVTRLVRSRDDIRDFFLTLTQDCYVVRHLFFSSHGSKGTVLIGQGETLLDEVPLKWVLGESGLSCALAPFARVQFDGCNLACKDDDSNGAEDILAHLTSLARNPNYAVPGDARPLGGTRFLFNSGKGIVVPPAANVFVGRNWHWNRGIRAENDSAIMYQFGGGQVRTDVPTSTAIACDP